MFQETPEIAIICVASGILLISRGWYALKQKTIKVRKTIGFPWQYNDVTLEEKPRLFYLTAWSFIVLGVFFLMFPFLVEYLV